MQAWRCKNARKSARKFHNFFKSLAFCHFFFKTNVFCVATQAKHEDHLHHTRALRHTRALCRPQDEHSRRLLQRVHFLVFVLSRTHFIFLRCDSSCMNFAIRFMTLVQHNFSILSSLSRLQSFLPLLRKWNMTIYKVENGAVEKTEEIRQYTLNKTSETSVTGFYVKDDDSVLVKMYATSSVIILFCSYPFCLSHCDCFLHLQSSFSQTLRMLLFFSIFLLCLHHLSFIIHHSFSFPSFSLVKSTMQERAEAGSKALLETATRTSRKSSTLRWRISPTRFGMPLASSARKATLKLKSRTWTRQWWPWKSARRDSRRLRFVLPLLLLYFSHRFSLPFHFFLFHIYYLRELCCQWMFSCSFSFFLSPLSLIQLNCSISPHFSLIIFLSQYTVVSCNKEVIHQQRSFLAKYGPMIMMVVMMIVSMLSLFLLSVHPSFCSLFFFAIVLSSECVPRSPRSTRTTTAKCCSCCRRRCQERKLKSWRKIKYKLFFFSSCSFFSLFFSWWKRTSEPKRMETPNLLAEYMKATRQYIISRGRCILRALTSHGLLTCPIKRTYKMQSPLNKIPLFFHDKIAKYFCCSISVQTGTSSAVNY